MSFPSRTRGLRTITVGEKKFHWKFHPALPEQTNSTLLVYGSVSGRSPLRLWLRGFQDSWTILFRDSSIPSTEIRPAFTHTAIDFALENGWNPDARGAAFETEWDGEKFRVVETQRRNND